MNIITKIKNSVQASTGESFYYGATQEINRVLDGAALPCSVMYLLQQGQITDENGFIHERLTAVVFFINKTQFDPDSIDNEDIIDTEKKKAFGWVSRLRLNDNLKLISVNSSERVYDEFDSIVTGYAVNVTIEEVSGIGLCNAPDPATSSEYEEGDEDDTTIE